MNWHDSPTFTFILAFIFAEDTIFNHKYFVTGLIIPVHMGIVLPSCIVVHLSFSVFPYFWPVNQKWDVKQHIPPKNCFTWWGFKYCVIGRVNSPCCIGEKVSNVTLSNCVGHVNFGCAEHCHDWLIPPLKYYICLGVLDTGWLMLQAIWITKGLKVKFECTSVVVDNVWLCE